MMFVRPTKTQEEQNLVAYQDQGQVYFTNTKPETPDPWKCSNCSNVFSTFSLLESHHCSSHDDSDLDPARVLDLDEGKQALVSGHQTQPELEAQLTLARRKTPGGGKGRGRQKGKQRAAVGRRAEGHLANEEPKGDCSPAGLTLLPNQMVHPPGADRQGPGRLGDVGQIEVGGPGPTSGGQQALLCSLLEQQALLIHQPPAAEELSTFGLKAERVRVPGGGPACGDAAAAAVGSPPRLRAVKREGPGPLLSSRRRGREGRPRRAFPCSACGKVFISVEKLKVHSYSHTGERPYKCSIEGCSKAFVSKYKLLRHVATHSPQKTHKCPHCEKMFHRKDHLKNHLQTHNPNKLAYKCEECGKKYNTKLGFRRHVALHAAASGDLTCRVCSAQLESTPTLLEHLKTHASKPSAGLKEKRHTCEQCERRFYTRKDVRRHMVVHTGRKDFVCQFCSQRFGRKDHLTRHAKKSHGQEVLKGRMETHQEILGMLGVGSLQQQQQQPHHHHHHHQHVREDYGGMLAQSTQAFLQAMPVMNVYSQVGASLPPLSPHHHHHHHHQQHQPQHQQHHNPLSLPLGCMEPVSSPIHSSTPQHVHGLPLTLPHELPTQKYQLGSTSFCSDEAKRLSQQHQQHQQQQQQHHQQQQHQQQQHQQQQQSPSAHNTGGAMDDGSSDPLLQKESAAMAETLSAAGVDLSQLLSFLPLSLPGPAQPAGDDMGETTGDGGGGYLAGEDQGHMGGALEQDSLEPSQQGVGGGLNMGHMHPMVPPYTSSVGTPSLPRFHQAFQ
ncbi:zinc finger protein PLAG1-like [Petromyzon marinus]|uniref:zinc finger protein PLAG1-like n=1 Tax=Petromyzon marinus TaxID=7757 RepID=UPI003F730199